jgi:hypothetical protein
LDAIRAGAAGRRPQFFKDLNGGGKLAVWSELDAGTELELTIPGSIAYAKSFAGRENIVVGANKLTRP